MTLFIKKPPESIWQKFNKLNFLVKIEIEVLIIFVIVVLGTFAFHRIEGWRYLDSLYFVVTTLGAVGYGDFYPKTDIGKILSMFYIVIGVPLFIYTAALVVEGKLKQGKK